MVDPARYVPVEGDAVNEVTVGNTVSIAIASELLAAALVLPAASENAPTATLIAPAVVDALVGVNVAV